MADRYLLGNAKGPQGLQGIQGISVSNVAINAEGHLIITLSNGATIDAGIAKGGKGDTGASGPIGKSAYQQAVEGGYAGTEAEFSQDLISISNRASLGPDRKLIDAQVPAAVKVAFTPPAGMVKTNVQEAISENLSWTKAQIEAITVVFDHGTTPTDLKNYLPNGMHRCANWINCPPGAVDGQGNCIVINYISYGGSVGWAHREFISAHYGVWHAHAANSSWSEWGQIAFASPSEEHDILFMPGFAAGNKSTCFRGQDGRVYIELDVYRPDGSDISGGTHIATLPEGFRPKTLKRKFFVGQVAGGGSGPTGHMYIGTDGMISVWPEAVVKSIISDFSFLAAA